jgi:hypothetical protein
MIAIPLTPRIRFAVIAAASYVRKRGRPSRPRELERFNCIRLRRSTGSIFEWDFVEDGKPVKAPINGSLIVNDVEVCLRAVLRGVGFEPSLGSFDRMTDQSKAWRQQSGELCYSADAEQDDADNEDSDPAEESEASGIADQDGLDEQVPFRDWQGVGMV